MGVIWSLNFLHYLLLYCLREVRVKSLQFVSITLFWFWYALVFDVALECQWEFLVPEPIA